MSGCGKSCAPSDRRAKTHEISVGCRQEARPQRRDVFNSAALLADLGLRPDARLFFSNHHFTHALPSLFFTDWDEALLYTADGSRRPSLLQPLPVPGRQARQPLWRRSLAWPRHPSGSLGLAYGSVTEALGWKINRHEGKLTGLAAYGEPTLLPEMLRHFSISRRRQDRDGFRRSSPHCANAFMPLASTRRRENAAASVQALLEHCIRESVSRLLERHQVRRFGLAGGVFANVRLNRLLSRSLAGGRGIRRAADGR